MGGGANDICFYEGHWQSCFTGSRWSEASHSKTFVVYACTYVTGYVVLTYMGMLVSANQSDYGGATRVARVSVPRTDSLQAVCFYKKRPDIAMERDKGGCEH